MKIRNPKSEIRKTFWSFKSLNFDIVSSFVLRASNLRGFTLIEVLVAATIIGLLSTIGLTGYQAITRNGRDVLRKSDIEQIRSALEIYKSDNGNYPGPTTTCAPAVPSSYINYPVDPKPSSYQYCYIRGSTSNLTYTLCSHLENGSLNASSDYCGDSGGVLCAAGNLTANCNYQTTNP